jgi:RNA polymerase sigma factor for flagellar operon FliA
MDAEQLFLACLGLVERLVATTCRRHRLTREESEDFASVVKLKLLADDYAVLRAYGGRSSLRGYLAAVVQHAYLDHCNHLWGKWRPSAEARRHGALAVRLETLLHRDGLSIDQACAMAAPAERNEMRRLAPLLPARFPRRFEDGERLARLAAKEGSPEADLLDKEHRQTTEALASALAAAIEELPPADRLLLKLRCEGEVTMVSLARSLGVAPRQLYGQWESLLRRLRAVLEPRLGAAAYPASERRSRVTNSRSARRTSSAWRRVSVLS